jgi:hypothetical protein
MQTLLSFWERETYFSRVDVVIAGSGIVGLNAALILKLKNPSLNILVAERGPLPTGASTKNAGFACFGSVTELADDLTRMSEEEVFALVEKRFLGLQRLRKTIGDAHMQFYEWGGHEVFDDEQSYEEAAQHIHDFNHKLKPIIGTDLVYKNSDSDIHRFGFANVKHMILNTAEGQIDTGQMMSALIAKVLDAGVKILNGLQVVKAEADGRGLMLHCANGYRFKTGKLLICTNGFAKEFLPAEDVEPARAQVLVTSPIESLKIRGTFHYDKGYYYFRNIGERVLLGGGRNLDFKAENTTDHSLTALIQEKLDRMLKEMILPGINYSVEMRWAGTMGVGAKKDPIVKKVQENIYCAVRMGGMGVALGSLAGEEAAEMVTRDL